MALMEVGLDDKYRLDAKRIFLSGIQALVRLPMMQRRRDLAAGLNTAGFIRLSRLAAWRLRPMRCGGQNPSCGMTSGSSPGLSTRTSPSPPCGAVSRSACFPARRVDGVFGIWYGKGPGVDRSVDALKHANAAGTSPNGGVHCAGGRRSWLPVLHARPSERAGLRRRLDAGGQSGDAAGLSRSRHPRFCAVALLELLGRLQGDLGDGRKLGLDRQRP